MVLASRRRDALDEVARECEAIGARTRVVATDVTDAEAVRHLADEAMAAFGGVDIWINVAGVGVFGPYENADVSLHRKVIEVNLLGPMYAAAAMLPVFKRQGHGILINTISLGGWAPTPFAAAYTASKFGLRGFSASLRQQLEAHEDIHVCGVFPAMVDTPGFVHGANMSGRTLDPGLLLYRPEDVADAMVRLARYPRGEVSVGWPARAGQIAYSLAPRATELIMGAAFRRLLDRASPAALQEGALLEPIPAGRDASGGWLDRKGMLPAGQVSTALAFGVGLLAVAGFAAASRRRARRF